MALAIKDRVKETTTTTGTGTYTLGGAVTGFETFTANLSNADTTYYACTDNTNFEVGIGTFTSSGTTLARTTILASSNSNSAVNWSSGTRTIFMTYPADKAVYLDASGQLVIGGTAVTTTAAELNLIDGGTARGTTAVASGDGILINDGGTMRMTNVDTVSTYFSSHNVGGSNIVTTGALDSGSITSGFGSIDTGSSTITTTGLISGGSLDIDNVLIDGTTIGHTDDTDLITLADGVVTVAGELDASSLDISGNADIDGTLEADAITVDGTALATYIRDTVGTNMLSSNTESGITVTYDTTNDNIDFSVDAAQTGITSLLATDIKIGEDDETKIDFETADEIHFYANNVSLISLTNANSGDAVLTVPTADKNFTIAGTDGSSGITALDIDMASAGAATFNSTVTATGFTIGSAAIVEAELETIDGVTAGTVSASKAVVVDANKDIGSFRNVTLTGELDAATGDFSGDVDVDGTLEADAITVDGTALNTVIANEATALAIALG